MRFGKNFIKQKLQGAPDLVDCIIFLDPKSRSGRIWAQCASGAVVPHFQEEFIKQKSRVSRGGVWKLNFKRRMYFVFDLSPPGGGYLCLIGRNNFMTGG